MDTDGALIYITCKTYRLEQSKSRARLILQRQAQTQTTMSKKPIPADELIWLFHEKLARTAVPSATIAIVSGGNNWTALTNAADRRRHPELATTVARIQKHLRGRYNLKQS